RLARDPPGKNANIRDVVFASPASDIAHVGGMSVRIERRIQQAPPGVANVREGLVAKPDVIHVLGGCQQQKVLDYIRFPARDIARQLLESRDSPFPPAEIERVGDERARTERRTGKLEHAASAHQVADIGNYPILARFNELIVVSLLQAVL